MKRIGIGLALLLFGIIAVFGWWQNGLQAANSLDKSSKMFVVQKGAGIREIANNLKEQGLIKDPVVFFLLIKQLGLDQKIQAGDFKLSPSMNANEIANQLTVGIVDIWVTIPEGKRALEIGEILKEKIPSYESTWDLELSKYEGYLFPDTYLIPKDATIDQIITIMKDNFETKFSSISLSNKTFSKEETVIMASMIEREAKKDSEKPIIAGIIKNRIDDGIPLQIDATIQYAKGISNSWWEPVTQEEYKSVKSEYNTYLYPGLPPGPISNPGLPSLSAAANPQETDYYYYLHDKNGVARFARTLSEHNRNIERYGL